MQVRRRVRGWVDICVCIYNHVSVAAACSISHAVGAPSLSARESPDPGPTRLPNQMLVYENYSKFIAATDTIRRMKGNVEGVYDCG